MINHRIMGNKGCTFVAEDRIKTQEEAAVKLSAYRHAARKASSDIHYFVQQYEVARQGDY